MRKLGTVLGWLLRLAVVGGCLAYVVRGVEWSAVAAAVRTYSGTRIAGAVGISLVAYSVLGLRLHVLSRRELGLRRGIEAGLVALGVNNVLPAKLGELAKVLYLRRVRQWPLGTPLALVFWERFLDVNLLLIIAVAAVALLGLELALWPLLAAVLGLWAGVVVLRASPGLAARILSRLPLRRAARPVQELVERVTAGLESRLLLAVSACTVLLWMLYALFAWAVLVWVAGFPLAPTAVLAVFVVSTLGMAVPSSPGALGVFEAAAVLSLSWFGVPKSEALPGALLLHLLQLIPSTLLGLTVLSLADLGLRDLWAERRKIRGSRS